MADVSKIAIGTTTYQIVLPNAVTFNNGGSGAASGSTYTGTSAITVSYNTVGAAASSHNHGAGNITSGTLAVARGGTGASTLDPAVATAGARNIYAGTSDMTAGTSTLTTGRVYLVYE